MIKEFQYALFDLDNTVYPKSCGLMKEIGNRINRFMIDRLGISPAEVSHRRDTFLRSHGTTLSALRHYHEVDPDEFLAFVHDIPLDGYLQYDPGLNSMLGRLNMKKIIFTNADAQHARRVLSRLGILHHFESILDIHFLEFVNKPNLRAYLKVLNEISAQPEECILVEDLMPNIIPAAKLGMATVLVDENSGVNGAGHHIRRITEFERLFVKTAAGNGEIPEEALSGTKADAVESDG